MTVRRKIALVVYFIMAGFTATTLVSCSHHSMEGMMVLTRLSVDHLSPGELPVNPEGGTLVAVDPQDPGSGVQELTPDFASACDPQVSYDATHLLFLGKKEPQDPWQVWEMDLAKKSARQVTTGNTSCYSPVYLPGQRIAFSREMPDTGTGVMKTLFTENLDGSNLQQITFHPNIDDITTVLKDGRLAMRSLRIFPDTGTVKYLAMRPNGTKAELFYQGAPGTVPGYRMVETPEKKLYFTETSPAQKKDLISVDYVRPLHSYVNYTAEVPGDFFDALPMPDGALMVSYQKTGEKNIGVYAFSTESRSLGEALLADPAYAFVDPVLVAPYERPRHLPNELNLSYPTGLIVCQNANIKEGNVRVDPSAPVTAGIRILGMDKSLGIVPLEPDGSFYLKIPADIPFRLQAVDEHRKAIDSPSDWIWVRPFERRGCVGCHEDPELVPDNVVPMAINYFPVVVPIDSTKELQRGETFKLSDMH